jgi:hypothetical protein
MRLALAVAGRRRTLPHNLLTFVDLETRQLQVLHDPLGEHLAGIVRSVLLEETAQRMNEIRGYSPTLKFRGAPTQRPLERRLVLLWLFTTINTAFQLLIAISKIVDIVDDCSNKTLKILGVVS